MTSGDFFRDITLRVCSSLDIRVSLDRCFALLRQHLPVDTLFLDIHDPKLGAIRRIAQTSGAGSENYQWKNQRPWRCSRTGY